MAQEWLDQSEYDFVTAQAMFKSGRYLYVAFMCQQSIEKHLKAVICEATNKMPPYIHNLTALSEHLDLKLNDDQLDFLELLSRYYLNARYPIVKQKLAKSLNEPECQKLIQKTEDFIKWLKKR